MLAELLNENTIALKQKAVDWKEAVSLVGNLLVKSGGVEPAYVEAMRQTVVECGPYIVLAPGIALPHARPGESVKRTSMALATLERPVEFGVPHNDPVDILISFATTDNQSHIQALAELSAILMEPANIERIRAATSARQVMALFGRE
ncbi:MAG: PTS transporter subunit EIIA [Firmicutes bacterium]|nr:PTS transporter subunit EIIA [Bacillota bacterium]